MKSKALHVLFPFLLACIIASSALTYAQSITGFSPSNICSGSSTVIQVTGSGFINAINVKVGSSSVSFSIINDNTIQILNTNGISTDFILIETSTATLRSPNKLIVTSINPNLVSTADAITCEGSSITYTASGGAFYEFFVDGLSLGPASPNKSITITPEHGENIYAQVHDTTMSCAKNTNVITANLKPVSRPLLISSSANVTVCNNNPLTSSIIFQLTPDVSDAFISGLPVGVTAEIIGNNVIINGTPNVNIAQDYNYVITPAGVPCASAVYGTISVTMDATLSRDTSSGNTSQLLCEGSPLQPITFNIGGGATDASVTGLPNGLNFFYDTTSNILSIEGTPSDNIAQEQTYNYTVTTSGSNCNEQTLRGTITVQPLAQLTLLPTSGALNQVLCEGEAIAPILIELEGGTDLINISGLPNGINYSLDASTQIATIFGTPRTPTEVINEFSYVISSISDGCAETTLQGKFTVNGNSNLEHNSISGGISQLLCEGSPLQPITFNISGGATDASVTGLPNGLNFFYDTTSNILSIEGTPSDNIAQEQTYNYTVTTSGSNCNEQTLRGTITVQPLAQLTLLPTSGALNQVLCEGEAIAPILIELEGGNTITSITGLPNGITTSFDSITKVLTVMGTPSEDIDTTKNMLISFAASTSCNTTYLRGSLITIPKPSVRLISHVQTLNQLVCGETPIEKIEYQLTDGATKVDVTGLPPGVDWKLDNTYLIISGVPKDVVYETDFKYSINIEGSDCSSTSTFSIIVTPNTIDIPTAESEQYFCIYDSPTINDIVVYGNNVKWYSANGVEELDLDTPLIDGETYYAHNEIIVSESSSIDRYACRSFAATIQVFIQDTAAPQILEPSNRFCLDGAYTLTDIKTNVDQPVWYSTSTSDTPLSMETPLESMTYYAAAIDPITGCESTTRTAFEIVVQPCNIKVYNALSINGDGLNEKLIIENISYFPENELMIYNRNGRLVYKTSNYGTNNNFFSGRANINSTINNSKVLPMGTYFYSFTYKRPLDQQYITTNGFINLVTN